MSTKKPRPSSARLNRRDAIKTIAVGTAGVALTASCSGESAVESGPLALPDPQDLIPACPTHYPFELPALSYHYGALGRCMDGETVEIHHRFHHQGYVNGLNDALARFSNLHDKSILELLADLDAVPETIRESVRNHGGGYLNHAILWTAASPELQDAPAQELAEAIDASFGSLDAMKQEMSEAARTVFGSGWAWLAADAEGKLHVRQTANQDTPLSDGLHPLLGMDVWEHAYYLRYQNRRADYIQRFWAIVNWYQMLTSYRSSRQAFGTA